MRVKSVQARVFQIPTDRPSGDGTLAWNSTTMVLVEVSADSGTTGLGYTYGAAAAGHLVTDKLASEAVGREVDDVRQTWASMVAAVRNAGRPGIAAGAVSALDIALWDLRARIAGQSLAQHLGAARAEVPIYGSGGLTTYSREDLLKQMTGWVEAGIPRVKMKIGKDWGQSSAEDLARIAAVRDAIGPLPELFVDANGAYQVKQAIRLAERFAELGVVYFEEPVSSDHLDQLALVRRSTGLDVAAGEYGYDPWYFHDMLAAQAVDILQADVTRCLGVTGWLMAAEQAFAAAIPFSAHTAPAIHAHLGCVAPQISHLEYFHDHARIESMLFDGTLTPVGGTLRPDPGRPGLGLELKRADAERWRVA